MTGPAGQKGGTTADMLAGQRRSASVSGAIPMNEERLPKMDGRSSLPGTQVGPVAATPSCAAQCLRCPISPNPIRTKH